jgi:FixJ family two-component response regulator
VDFLVKPFEGKVLVAAIEAALSRSITAHALDGSLQRDWALFATLSPRERQVCLLFAQGLLNKQIAGELGTTERTIKASVPALCGSSPQIRFPMLCALSKGFVTAAACPANKYRRYEII